MTALSPPGTGVSDLSVSTRRTSPRTLARTTAVFYLLTILLGIYAESFVGDRIIVWTDAAATARNIVTHRDLWLSGLAAYLLEMACNVVMTVLFYMLLEPAGPALARVALALGL